MSAPRNLTATLRRSMRRAGLSRARVRSVRALGERTALSVRSRGASREYGRILCYHSVGTPEWGINDVTPKRFRRQLEAALAAGYTFVPAAEIARTGGTSSQLALTFDDGLTSVSTQAAAILAELHLPWTLFVVSDWAEGNVAFPDGLMLGWRDIERLAGAGAEIGSHSVTHADFCRITPERATVELCESRAMIESRLGIRANAFAIPNGRTRDWPLSAQNAAVTAGYETIYAGCEDVRPAGTAGRTMITSWDGDRLFRAALEGRYDGWEEWIG